MLRDVYNYLLSDILFTNYLPGGWYYGGEISHISRQYVPDAFDANSKLIPCAILQGNDSLGNDLNIPATMDYFSIFYYSSSTTDPIDDAYKRAYSLLQKTRIPDAGNNWLAEFITGTVNQFDQNLNCFLHIQRWRWVRSFG